MSIVIVPEVGDAYTASCDSCQWSMTVGSEPFAETMGQQHESFARHAETKGLLERYAALPAVSTDDQHRHNPACTDATCPGLGFPTREELISKSNGRRRDTSPSGGVETRHKSGRMPTREVPV